MTAAAQSAAFKDFSYGLASDLNENVQVQISCLAGFVPPLSLGDLPMSAARDLRVTCQLWMTNSHRPLSMPIKSNHKHFSSADTYEWNQWIQFPCRYNELPFSTIMSFIVSDIGTDGRAHVVGGTTVRLFESQQGMLLKGRQKLLLSSADSGAFDDPRRLKASELAVADNVDRLEELQRLHASGEVDHVDWLDKLILASVENERNLELKKSRQLFLYINFPDLNVPVIFNEPAYSHAFESYPGVIISDPEMMLDNPVELKHRRLVRGHRAGPFDRELKPNPKTRDDLHKIFRYPPTQPLSSDESDLLWKFRFYLTRDKHALTKFLKCVDWADVNESKQALELLPLWSDIEADDALELLGPSFKNPVVRQHAIKTLERANDDDLLLYLLQLVEAIKFENIEERGAYESPLVEFLVRRALQNVLLGNDFHWYLMTECEDKVHSKTFAKVSYHFMTRMVEMTDGYLRRDMLRRQADLIERLSTITRDLRSTKDARPKKIENLQALLADSNSGLLSFAPFPLPVDASVEVCGIVADKATIFKSNLMPLRLTFRTTNDRQYTVMFKIGDDLRQDQLVMQVIKLMDKLLKKENLDLKLTPYRILATGTNHGMLEFVHSVPVATIMSKYSGNIQTYLRDNNPQPSATDCYGIVPSVLDAYVRSCAGYCVITYLLGIGDRHLDNLLLTPQGNLFHIDFGYILGRDPKPFPPPMKLIKEMVDAMGGISSAHFQKFKSLCYSAFMILRKSSNLILNLFALMVDANIPDIKFEPDKAVAKVQEKFRLDLSDEEAIQFFQTIINDSVTAVVPQLMETVHKMAQYLRK
eukprot:Partr_v1_DN27836_c0_g1_i1_m23389 putative Phosphatidylinositol 3kinase